MVNYVLYVLDRLPRHLYRAPFRLTLPPSPLLQCEVWVTLVKESCNTRSAQMRTRLTLTQLAPFSCHFFSLLDATEKEKWKLTKNSNSKAMSQRAPVFFLHESCGPAQQGGWNYFCIGLSCVNLGTFTFNFAMCAERNLQLFGLKKNPLKTSWITVISCKSREFHKSWYLKLHHMTLSMCKQTTNTKAYSLCTNITLAAHMHTEHTCIHLPNNPAMENSEKCFLCQQR